MEGTEEDEGSSLTLGKIKEEGVNVAAGSSLLLGTIDKDGTNKNSKCC